MIPPVGPDRSGVYREIFGSPASPASLASPSRRPPHPHPYPHHPHPYPHPHRPLGHDPGLTPAQLYPAQVDGPRLPYRPVPVPVPVPRLAVDGRPNVDSSPNDPSSELPWVQPDPSPRHQQFFAHQLHRQPSPLALSDSPHPRTPLSSLPRSSSYSISPDPPLLPLPLPPNVPPGRRSSDSIRVMHTVSVSRAQDRSLSMSVSPRVPKHASRPSAGTRSSLSGTATRPHHHRPPVVYPALLSRVAEAFRDRILLADRVKDGLTYKEAFDGREAVDTIAFVIKTTDRNLALLLGRALDAQKFLHDVTYDHRLRDSASELYRFRTKLSPFVSGELASANRPHSDVDPGHGSVDSHDKESSPIAGPVLPSARQGTESIDEVPLPTGVFTLLTDCYSPTCTRDQLCYSIACPRRLEQQARLNMKPQPGLKKEVSEESLDDFVEPGTLWIHTVPKEVVNSVSDTEKKRQEAINEVIYTERDFVRDMEYLRDVWIANLKDGDIIPAEHRADFVQQVFWNIHDIIAVNTRLRDALNKRQKAYAVVERIGDIFADIVPQFEPFVWYGAHQLYGKYEFEKEKTSNPAFAAFVETTERLPESRKLELNGYLTKPTTRLARYPLLLEAVTKHTSDDNPDKHTLTQVVSIVRDFLSKVNVETGKTENRFNLMQLDQQLVYRPGEHVDLRLQDPNRELVYKGALNRRGGAQGDNGDLLVYLFDHALLMVKQKSKHEQYKVYRRPIPLELLFVSVPDESPQGNRPANRQQRTLTKRNSFSRGAGAPYAPAIPVRVDGKGGFAITFVHLGRKFYQLTLWASTFVSHRKWVETIAKQREVLRERGGAVFDTVTVSEGFFLASNKVNCAAPYGGGRYIVYGTEDGVYLSDLQETNRDPVKVLAMPDVLQVDVLEDYQLLILLSERVVSTVPLDALEPKDPTAGLKRAKQISSHTSFFKAGVCLGKVLVCIVKSSPLSSTIKTLEPIDQSVRARSKPTLRKRLQGGIDTLKLFKEFYIPVESSSIHFLKTKLCVGCSKGFEIVDLESLDTQGLLDPADPSLEFVRKKENLRPMAIYRIENEFLLCYDEFAFYVNKNGWRSRSDFMVCWEGSPTGFALQFPYVLAFEPMFVEIRHVETGQRTQVIQGNNLRLLFADAPPSTSHAMSAYHNAYYRGQMGYPGYQQPHGPGYGRPPGPVAGYGAAPPMYGAQTYMQPPPPQLPTYVASNSSSNSNNGCREKILMVSDDRVLTLRLACENGQGSYTTMSDAASGSSR